MQRIQNFINQILESLLTSVEMVDTL